MNQRTAILYSSSCDYWSAPAYASVLGTETFLPARSVTRYNLLAEAPPNFAEILNRMDRVILLGATFDSEGNWESPWPLVEWEAVTSPILGWGLKHRAHLKSPTQKAQFLVNRMAQTPGLVFAETPEDERQLRALFRNRSLPVFGAMSQFYLPQTRRNQIPIGLLLPRGKLSPATSHYYRNLVNEVRSAGGLCVVQDTNGLNLCSRPGPSVFVNPQFPQITLQALFSCDTIICADADALALWDGRGHAIAMVKNDRGRNKAAFFGVSSIDIRARPTLPKIQRHLRRTKSALVNNGSWDTIPRRAQLKARLAQEGFSELKPTSSTVLRTRHVATIVSQDYLPFLFGLMENFRDRGLANIKWHILALDDFSKKSLGKEVNVYLLKDLWSKKQCQQLQRLSLPRRAYFSKAALLKKALIQAGDSVLFSDVDLYFTENPSEIWEIQPKLNGILFPHWHHKLDNNHLHGIYNAGLILARQPLGEWVEFWRAYCAQKIFAPTSDEYHEEQGVLDLVPLYFPDVGWDTSKQHNIAHWNTAEFPVELPSTHPEIAFHRGKPVKSFHASQPCPSPLSEAKSLWDQLMGFKWKSRLATEQILFHQGKHWIALGRWVRIQRFLRFRWMLPLSLRWMTRAGCTGYFGRLLSLGLAWLYGIALRRGKTDSHHPAKANPPFKIPTSPFASKPSEKARQPVDAPLPKSNQPPLNPDNA